MNIPIVLALAITLLQTTPEDGFNPGEDPEDCPWPQGPD